MDRRKDRPLKIADKTYKQQGKIKTTETTTDAVKENSGPEHERSRRESEKNRGAVKPNRR